jgi:branched-chain amino acid transport system substrate-binding protein
MAHYMNQKDVKTLYLLGPNYAAGKDMLGGVSSVYKGRIIGQELTKWPSQLDFSAELSKVKAARPDGNKYVQAGLKGTIPLYTAFTIDSLSLPRQGEAALGVPGVQQWVNDLPNATNKKFVADFKAKHKAYPSFYGAQSYDAVNLINSAVVAVSGDLSKKDAMRAEMKKANFASVRGIFTYGNNQVPIQNFYLQEATKDQDGTLTLKTVATIVESNQDRFHRECSMN